MASLDDVRVDMEQVRKLPKHKQRELKGLLQKLADALEANPLAGYQPHKKQQTFHSAQARVRCFRAGNRTGKTMGGVADDLIQLLPDEWIPSHLKAYKRWEPPVRGRVILPDFTTTIEGVMGHLRDLTPRGSLRGGSWEKAYDKVNRVLHFECGSFLDFLTYGQDLDKFGSVSRHFIHYDEEPPQDIRTQGLKRLADTGGHEIFTFTPELGISWTFEEFEERKTEPGIAVITAGMRDNPHLSEAEIERVLAAMPTKEERRIAEFGDYVALGGTFYPEFAERHIHDEVTPDHVKDQSIVVGIDPGYNTTAVLWGAFDSDNEVLIFEERYFKKKIPSEISEVIKAVNAMWGVKSPRYVIDPSARNRGTASGDRLESAFIREGVYVEHGENDRELGILEVKRRLQADSLSIARNCTQLLAEIPKYRRDPKGNDEWQAIKRDDHGADALRYLTLARAWDLPRKPKKKHRPSTTSYQAPYKLEPQIREPSPLGDFA